MLGLLKKLFSPPSAPVELSRAQIALLSQFNTAKQLKASGWRESWEAVLSSDPQSMLEKFVKVGLIAQAPLEDNIDYLSVVKLKAILKKLGLPVSGKKALLVERVLSSKYDILKNFPDGKLWKCSQAGFSFVTPYLAAEAYRKQHAIDGAKEALAEGNLNLAAEIAADYQAKDVFGAISLSGELLSDGLSVTVKKAKGLTSRAEEIFNGASIFQRTKRQRPVPFRHVPATIFNEAADSCTWSCLQLGKGERSRDAERVALELWGWRTSNDNLARLKKSEADGIITGVEILCGDECPVGSSHKGKVYSTAETPELPLIGCTREPCCACTYIARVKDF